jgi:hypothetical protein
VVAAVTRRPARAALFVGVLLFATSCSGGAPDASVEFDIEPLPGQPWTASGDLVDAGLLCPEGSRRHVALLDSDGTPLPADVFFRRVGEAFEQSAEAGGRFETDLLNEQEWTCADGSGSFTLLETIGESGEWRVVSGLGAYAGMTGEGTHSLVWAPAPSGPDDPPEGEVVGARFTGTVQLGSGG